MEPEVKLTDKILTFLKKQCHQIPQDCKETEEIQTITENEPQPSSIPFRLVRYAFTEYKKLNNTGAYFKYESESPAQVIS